MLGADSHTTFDLSQSDGVGDVLDSFQARAAKAVDGAGAGGDWEACSERGGTAVVGSFGIRNLRSVNLRSLCLDLMGDARFRDRHPR